jgi:hypothetical protein
VTRHEVSHTNNRGTGRTRKCVCERQREREKEIAATWNKQEKNNDVK